VTGTGVGRRSSRADGTGLLRRALLGGHPRREGGFKFIQVGGQIGLERRMFPQAREVREGSRITRPDAALQDRRESSFFERDGAMAFVEEQTQLSGKADIRKS